VLIFGLGVLFVFLVLSAQYESFILPLVVILSVPLAILAALASRAALRLSNDVFCQIGLVMLVGVEQERDPHRGVRRAAEGARTERGGSCDRGGDDPAPPDPE